MLRSVPVALLFACVLSVRPAFAGEAKKAARPAIMVLALEDGPPSGSADFALVLRTLGTLEAIGGSSYFHPKQVRAVLETHGDRFAALPAKKRIAEIGKLLGADWALSVGFSSLKPKTQ